MKTEIPEINVMQQFDIVELYKMANIGQKGISLIYFVSDYMNKFAKVQDFFEHCVEPEELGQLAHKLVKSYYLSEEKYLIDGAEKAFSKFLEGKYREMTQVVKALEENKPKGRR